MGCLSKGWRGCFLRLRFFRYFSLLFSQVGNIASLVNKHGSDQENRRGSRSHSGGWEKVICRPRGTSPVSCVDYKAVLHRLRQLLTWGEGKMPVTYMGKGGGRAREGGNGRQVSGIYGGEEESANDWRGQREGGIELGGARKGIKGRCQWGILSTVSSSPFSHHDGLISRLILLATQRWLEI